MRFIMVRWCDYTGTTYSASSNLPSQSFVSSLQVALLLLPSAFSFTCPCFLWGGEWLISYPLINCQSTCNPLSSQVECETATMATEREFNGRPLEDTSATAMTQSKSLELACYHPRT
ncbi:hypothetical protein C8R45DRAFT_384219 [Mycena sanguinolenta]|nr:hypothetical protein C8R45DRAFT_384219 [Mycena sanguinolenta]